MLWIARGYGSGRAKLVLAEDFLATYTGGCWNTDIMTTLLALSFASTKVLRLPWIIFSIHFKNLEVSYRILFSHHEIPKAQWCVSWVQSPEQTGRNQHFSCHLRNEQHQAELMPFPSQQDLLKHSAFEQWRKTCTGFHHLSRLQNHRKILA